jgi:hypothetical protein
MKGKNMSDQNTRYKLRLWLWFVFGFLLVFVCTSFTITMYSMVPSGGAVVACKLWKYYVIEIRRAVSSSGALGPANGSTSALPTTVLQHFLFSVAGGVGMMGIGLAYQKLKGS